ncbi:MAG TPA: ABC transporter permease [Egibacteraceae bacterium]|nr:ABC transporter permease [Egibacteraceae bacterium]
MTNIAWKNLGHQRARFLLSTGGVAFAVLLILIVRGLYDGILTQATDYARNVDADLWVSQAATPDRLIQSTSTLSADLRDELAGVAGVAGVYPLLTRAVTFPLDGRDVDLFLVGVDGARAAGWPRGLGDAAPRPRPGELVIDRVFAKIHGLAPGDVLDIGGTRMRVAAVVRGGNALVYQYAWLQRRDVARLFDAQGLASHFLVRTEGASTARVARDLEREVAGVRARTSQALADAEAGTLGDGFRPMLFVLVLIAMAVGAATIGLIIYTATIERAREYGVLKAIGFSNRRLYTIVFQQSMISAAAGFVAGCALAFGVAALAEVLQPVFVASISPSDVGFAGAATAGMALVASFVPARPIARLHPAEVFRA